MKKIFLIFLLLLFFSLGFVYLRYRHIPSQTIPYPYIFSTSSIPAPFKNAPKLLLVGDGMAKSMERYLPLLQKSLSLNLKEPITVASWAGEHTSLARTLQNLKSLPTFPKIVLYLGGSQEFFEKKLHLPSAPLILENFKRYEDSKRQTILFLFPYLSRFIYKPIQFIKMPASIQVDADFNKYNDEEIQTYREISYTLYQYELKELIDLCREKESLLILFTNPLNLEVPPKKVCENAQDPQIVSHLEEIKQMIERQDFKKAYEELIQLKEKTPGHAEVFYLLGMMAKKLRLLPESFKYLKWAQSFDCQSFRGSEVYNALLRKVASEEQVLVYDFAHYLENESLKNTVFIDDIYPQDLYYQKAILALGQILRKYLQI